MLTVAANRTGLGDGLDFENRQPGTNEQ